MRVHHVNSALLDQFPHPVRLLVHSQRRLVVHGHGDVLDAAFLEPRHQGAPVAHHGHVMSQIFHAHGQAQHVCFHTAHVQLGQQVKDVEFFGCCHKTAFRLRAPELRCLRAEPVCLRYNSRSARGSCFSPYIPLYYDILSPRG